MTVDASLAPSRRWARVDIIEVGLTGVAIALIAIAAAFVSARLTVPADGTFVGGQGDSFGSGWVAVTPNDGGSGATPLEAGDRVVSMLGHPVEAWAVGLFDPARSRPAIGIGDSVAFEVDRGGQQIQATIVATPFDAVGAVADDWGVLALALSMQVVGGYLFFRRPHEPAAQALFIAGTGMFTSTVPWALGLQATDLAVGATFWLYVLATGLAYSLFWSGALHFALVFPRPHPFAADGRRVLALAYLAPIGAQGAFIIGSGASRGSVLAAAAAWLDSQAILQVAVIVTAVALMAWSYWRLTDSTSRLQLRWVACAVALNAVGSLVLWFGPELILGHPLLPRSAVALLGLPFPIALGIAINHHHLFDIDAVVNRSLVYGGLSAGVVLTYASTVALIGGLIPGNTPFAAALLGAGAVAVVALPLRDRLQRSVNHYMYGDRDDPEGALRRLGRRLQASPEPETVLPTLVEAVADALRSPYVAIELERGNVTQIEAAHGEIPTDLSGPRPLIRVPIQYRGRPVGAFALAPRGASESFSRADETLLADLARQAAPTIEAIRLTADLRRSRMALVRAREEERRRLRRDLHDGLGPGLAASLMKLGAVRAVMTSDPDRAAAMLDGIDESTRGMIDEIRRIARNLRPPALDELGLVGTLLQHVATFGPPDLGGSHGGGSSDEPAVIGTAQANEAGRPFRVSLEAPEPFPTLPAAVEVAGLRIALEGLTNAARHSGGSEAHLRLSVDGEFLVVAVTDDGTGMPTHHPPGVGLTSMRERCDELGGSLVVLPAEGGGTRLEARLPITPPMAT
jgi:two-component system NarL family sensor kinase